MATYQILYCHDIPVQVRARDKGRTRDKGGRASVSLPQRFQVAVDKAAMEAGLTGSDAYTETFRWGERQERAGAAQAVAEQVAGELVSQYPEIDWRATAATLKQQR